MIKKGGRVLKSIVDEEAVIEENAVVGGKKEITVIGNKAVIKAARRLVRAIAFLPSEP